MSDCTEGRGRMAVSLTGAHWEALLTQGRLHGWTEARAMGLTVAQCDRIADAAVQGVRKLMEEWAKQQEATREEDRWASTTRNCAPDRAAAATPGTSTQEPT